ncbi:MAG: reverse transcriptase family protein [Candidatus Competibacterales bacterium]
MNDATTPPPPTWEDIAADGGIDAWITARLKERDLIDEVTEPSALSKAELQRFKARREAERQARRELKRQAWVAYQSHHLVHLGSGVFYHDTVDFDRFDLQDPETRQEHNALPPLKSAQDLARALGLSIPQLRWLAFHREVDSHSHYHLWTVPKRDGSDRLISAPKPRLKAAQRWILREIVEHLPVHDAVHGFVAGRSTLSNAATHAGRHLVVKRDIKDFYPSIHWRRVKGVFRKAGYGEQVATVLALLCTEPPREILELEGRRYFVAHGPRALPQGAPTSPALSNALCLRLDCRLTGLARHYRAVYTRYADDLTFSLEATAGAKLGGLLKAVAAVVKAEGFALHPAKDQILRPGRRQTVTGLVVNQAPSDCPPVRIPRGFVRRLRAALHNRATGKGGVESLAQLRGWIAYLHMVDPERAAPYWTALKTLEEAAHDRS